MDKKTIKIKSILFNGEMVRAIIAGKKTQTRRPFKILADYLWVRETFAVIDNTQFGGKKYYEYKADTDNLYPGEWPPEEARGNLDAPVWRPSIHMPKEAARILLKVKCIYMEKLGNISESDAKEEGMKKVHLDDLRRTRYPNQQKTYRQEFIKLWNNIYDGETKNKFENNPFVSVIKFEIIEPIVVTKLIV